MKSIFVIPFDFQEQFPQQIDLNFGRKPLEIYGPNCERRLTSIFCLRAYDEFNLHVRTEMNSNSRKMLRSKLSHIKIQSQVKTCSTSLYWSTMKNAFTPLTLHEKWSIWRANKESSMILSWPLAAKLLSCQTAKKPIKHRDLYLKWPAHIKKQLCNRNLLVSIISCAYRMKSKSEQHWGSCFKFAPWQPKNLSSKFNYTVSTRSDFMSFSWIS